MKSLLCRRKFLNLLLYTFALTKPSCATDVYAYLFSTVLLLSLKKKQKQSVRAASCTQSGPEKVVKQECRQLHCCIRERSLSSPPQLTCRNRCLSYTPFGVGHFFLMYLIVIHFRNSSDVCTASNPSNNLHSNKSAPHCLTKPQELRLSVEKFLL